MSIEVPSDIAGFKRLISRQFDVEGTIAEIKGRVVKEGKARRQPPPYPIPANGLKPLRRKRAGKPCFCRLASARWRSSTRVVRMLSDLRRELSDTDLDLVVKTD